VGAPSTPGPDRQVRCPVCGGIVEADTEPELIRLAKAHTRRAHGYDVPDEHVISSIEDID